MCKNSILFSTSLLFLLLNGSNIYCFFSSSWTESGDVVVLTNENFHSIVKQHDVLLIMFYVKWCSYCRRLHPDYEKAATMLSKNTNTSIHIAKLDCTNDDEAQCEKRYNVNSYPALRIYRYGRFNGEELNFLNRTSSEMVKTMKALNNVSEQQQSIQFGSSQTNGVQDQRNNAAGSIQYTWLCIGLFYSILQKYVI